MSTAIVIGVIILVSAAAFVLVIAICRAAARGDRP